MTLKVLNDKPDALIIKTNYHIFELLNGISCRLYVLCVSLGTKVVGQLVLLACVISNNGVMNERKKIRERGRKEKRERGAKKEQGRERERSTENYHVQRQSWNWLPNNKMPQLPRWLSKNCTCLPATVSSNNARGVGVTGGGGTAGGRWIHLIHSHLRVNQQHWWMTKTPSRWLDQEEEMQQTAKCQRTRFGEL